MSELSENIQLPGTAGHTEDGAGPGSVASGQLPSVLPAGDRTIAELDNRGRGWLAAFCVVVLGCFLAASAVRNTDFWLHLASGKAIAQGDWQADPFSYTSGESVQVNHFWLYELLCYWLYLAVGASGLVIIKCLAVAVLALVMVACARASKDLLLPALGGALSLVALGPWLSFKPLGVSFLFLALTLFILEKNLRAQAGPSSWRGYWPLFPLFALWVNMDRWFFIGPAVVALYCAGSFFPRRQPASISRGSKVEHSPPRRTMPVVLLASLAACLASPYGLANLQLPPELLATSASSPLHLDFFLREQFVNPFAEVYSSRHLLHYPAGLAYWTLVVLGFVSFGMTYRSFRWQRFLTWMLFFGLSRLLTLGVPFFAVTAGPLSALNLADYLQRRERRGTIQPGLRRILGWGTSLAIAVLTLAAWSGWLQTGTPGPRSLKVEVDPSLERTALQIAHWRREGNLPWKGNGFNLSPDAANFFAWFCPEEKGFLTSQLAVPDTVLRDYMTLRQALIGPENRDWRSILRQRKIDHLFLFGSDRRLIRAAARKMLANSQEWPLLYVGGSMMIVGWRDPGLATGKDPFHGMEWNDRIAFGPGAMDVVPQTRPAREPMPFVWWEAVWRPRAQPSFDHDQATGLLELFELMGPSQGRKIAALLLANQVGTGCTSGTFLLTAPWQSGVLLDYLDEGPPGALFLAIQAARRALHDNPDNPETHFALGEAYFRLTRNTRERVWIKTFPHLGRIRTVQAVAGYCQAIRLNPNHLQAHLRLGEMYLGMHYKDTALEHFQAVLDIMTRHGPRSGENPDLFRQRKEFLRVRIESLSQDVKKLLEKYEINSEKLRLADRAKLAGQFGLTSKALTSLLATDISAFGVHGMELELKMLINAGQGAAVREWMEPEHEKKLGEAKANWIHVQLGAGSGDYIVADQRLPDATETIGAIKNIDLRKAIALQIGQAVLDAKTDSSLSSFLWFQARRLNDEANNRVLRGLLALEAGNRSQAREHFRRAHNFWASPAGIPFQEANAESRTGMDIARHYLAVFGNKPEAKR